MCVHVFDRGEILLLLKVTIFGAGLRHAGRIFFRNGEKFAKRSYARADEKGPAMLGIRLFPPFVIVIVEISIFFFFFILCSGILSAFHRFD